MQALAKAKEARALSREAEEKAANLIAQADVLYEEAKKKVAIAEEWQQKKLAKQEEETQKAEEEAAAATPKAPQPAAEDHSGLAIKECRKMLQATGAPATGVTDTHLEILMRAMYEKAKQSLATSGSNDGNTEAGKRSRESTASGSAASTAEAERHRAAQASTKAAAAAITQQLAAGNMDRARSRSPKRAGADYPCQMVDYAATDGPCHPSPVTDNQDEAMPAARPE